MALIEKEEQNIGEEQLAREYKEEVKLFNFDPNSLDLEGWVDLGLSAKQAQSILNYREKGGRFNVKKDLAKMYTISQEKFVELQPYILLPDTIAKERLWRNEPVTEADNAEPLLIELNGADSISLIRLSGIGPTYSSRIIKYRDLLGGFYSLDQLHEVWGLKDSTIEKIKPNLKIAHASWQMININSASIKELSAHPYIDWKIAKAIVNYRSQHGKFTELKNLKALYVLDDSLIHHFSPYLDFSDLKEK